MVLFYYAFPPLIGATLFPEAREHFFQYIAFGLVIGSMGAAGRRVAQNITPARTHIFIMVTSYLVGDPVLTVLMPEWWPHLRALQGLDPRFTLAFSLTRSAAIVLLTLWLSS